MTEEQARTVIRELRAIRITLQVIGFCAAVVFAAASFCFWAWSTRP
jgi:hypothetical protein